MGSLCSKSSTHTGGHTVLGSGPVDQNGSVGTQRTSHPDPRTAAAEAAERRMKENQRRGTAASNPNRGRLAAQAEAAAKKPDRGLSDRREEGRLVWD